MKAFILLHMHTIIADVIGLCFLFTFICSCVYYPVCVVAAVAVSPSSRSRLFFLHAPLPLHPPINLTLLFLLLLFASSLLSLLPSSFFLPDLPPSSQSLWCNIFLQKLTLLLLRLLLCLTSCTVPIWGWLVDNFLNIIMGRLSDFSLRHCSWLKSEHLLYGQSNDA